MKSYIEINKSNLLHNLGLFKHITGKQIMFVVKANAYGHGLEEVLSITKESDLIDYYAVDCLSEALTVKRIDPARPVLVIGWSDEQELETLIENQLETVAPSLEFLQHANTIAQKQGLKARVHLKVETGTSRMGIPPAQVMEFFNSPHYPHVEPVGIYSHFANIEDTTDHSFALKQLTVFNDLMSQLGDKPLLKHFSCSAAALLFPKTYFDIVRVGISAYGFWPSKPTYISYIEQKSERIRLKPVLSWRTKVAQVKTLETGDAIGYGITYRTFSKTKVAGIPVGYYDGYDRKLSNVATIIINGEKAPVRGRICMNMFMAEVTHIPHIKAGDTVTLIGGDGGETIEADHLAELSGTINYETVARINPLLPRKVV